MKDNSKDLKSSVKEIGTKVVQIIHFVNGEKRTFYDIDSTRIRQGQFTKVYQTDGTMIMINDKNVLCIEVLNQENMKK
tara:strand:- start:2389 stop:2622 length:234 start_codon:yes stop_codon:yes gene_type:complete